MANICVRSLIKSYEKREVLNIPELIVPEGEIIALMGRNGSGKSTLMRILALNEAMDSGELRFGDQVQTSKTQTKDSLAFICENQHLPFNISISKWAKIFSGRYVNYNLATFSSLCESLSINPEATHLGLSRGQKVKAMVALQCSRPLKYLLLDEVAAVLDLGSRVVLSELVRKLANNGTTVIASSNIGTELDGIADKIVILEEGRVVLDKSVDQAYQDFQKVRVFKGELVSKKGFIPIVKNSDGSWTCITNNLNLETVSIADIESDNRQVQVSDILAFYTSRAPLYDSSL